ncbi:MAG: NAD-dependent epimerase/dehydratase family protein [Planctomycetota bacterium]|nr:NAD-dependent epimerase/dehydratase family protein [Planctomycetota bacterium]
MQVLVTGGTGLVGNNVVRMLLNNGHEVRVLVRDKNPGFCFEGLDVELVQGDICDFESIIFACEGVDAVIHSAAMVHIGWSQLERQREVNVGGTINLAKAALSNDIRMVYVSSVDALGIGTEDHPADEDSPRIGKIPCSYVVSKSEAEQELRKFIDDGLDAVIVNPGFMLGPNDWKPSSGKMLLEVAEKKPLIAPSGGMMICHIDDVTAGIVAALEKGVAGRNYILGGTRMSYLDAWSLFADVVGNNPPRRKMGKVITTIAGYVGDLVSKMSRRESDINSAAIKMGSLFHYYDSSRAVEELDYTITDPRKTVEDAWEWFNDHGYVAK